jgi:hypothetical protein
MLKGMLPKLVRTAYVLADQLQLLMFLLKRSGTIEAPKVKNGPHVN